MPSDVTELLDGWARGRADALEKLMPKVVDELRRVANAYFAGERKDHTLQPTALVNEVFLRLADRRKVSWKSRSQFFGFAAQTMRRILVDHARRRQSGKRGGDLTLVSLDDSTGNGPDREEVSLIALDDALRDLARLDPEGCQIVEMRFFAGLTYDEIAEVLGLPSIRVRRQWTTARLWLFRELSASDETGQP